MKQQRTNACDSMSTLSKKNKRFHLVFGIRSFLANWRMISYRDKENDRDYHDGKSYDIGSGNSEFGFDFGSGDDDVVDDADLSWLLALVLISPSPSIACDVPWKSCVME